MSIGLPSIATRFLYPHARPETADVYLAPSSPDVVVSGGLSYALTDANAHYTPPTAANILGTPGNDRLMGGPGAYTLDGGGGIDTAVFMIGSDWTPGVRFDGSGVGSGQSVTLDDGSGHPKTLINVTNLEVHGPTVGAIQDAIITGGWGNNALYGGNGTNILTSGTGVTNFYAGPHDNVFNVNNTFDHITTQPGGYNTVFASVPFTAPAGVQALYLTGSAVSGRANADGATIVGNNLGDLLIANGDAHIYGGAGNDRLQGGPGNNYLDGGGGVNSAIYHLDTDWTAGKPFDGSAVGPQGGTLLLDGGPGHQNTLVNIQRLEITGFLNAANMITGSSGGADIIHGGNKGNVIVTGSGNAKISGGAGDDTIYVNNVSDLIQENPGAGHVTVYSSVSYHLPPNVHELHLTGYAFVGTGNDQGGNLLYASDNGSLLRAGAGGDTLYGGAGTDTLRGGAGADTIYAGSGTATLDGGAGADLLVGGAGPDTFIERKGQADGDTIQNFLSGKDHIQLSSWGAGTTLVQTDAASHQWTITDGVDHSTNVLTILGAMHPTDILFG